MAFSEHEAKAPTESCTVCHSTGSACSEPVHVLAARIRALGH